MLVMALQGLCPLSPGWLKVRCKGPMVTRCRADDGQLFDRKYEVSQLKRYLRLRGRFILLTGPPDCGKSAVLKHLAGEEPGVTWVDLRGADYTTAKSFCEKIQKELPWSPGNLLPSEVEVKPLQREVSLTWSPEGGHLGFQEALWKLLKLERDAKPNARVPTFIIDEANALQDWLSDEVNQKALTSFLRFFVKITKQDNLANVILATSDDFFKFWLDKQISGSRYSKLAMGDFLEDEAQAFFEHFLNFGCPPDIWEDVYNTCGGRALLLKEAALYMGELATGPGDPSLEVYWSDMQQPLEDQAYDEVFSGLEPETLVPKAVPASWSRDVYLKLLREMCKAERGVVSWKDFTGICGLPVARALVCYNLVHVRVRSKLARDLDWYYGPWPVVMPISQPHLNAMKVLLAELDS